MKQKLYCDMGEKYAAFYCCCLSVIKVSLRCIAILLSSDVYTGLNRSTMRRGVLHYHSSRSSSIDYTHTMCMQVQSQVVCNLFTSKKQLTLHNIRQRKQKATYYKTWLLKAVPRPQTPLQKGHWGTMKYISEIVTVNCKVP